MKSNFVALCAALSLAPFCAQAQGTFIFDQQSSIEGNYLEGGANIQQSQPMGQSFIPQLSSVGFVRLYIYNGLLGNVGTAALRINLRSGSITGPLLASTGSVTIPGGSLFAAPVNFFFSSPVPVTPGTTYYLQPFVDINNNLGLNQGPYSYAGGSGIFQGIPDPNSDLWFREGLYVIPEPLPATFAILAIAGFIASRRILNRTCSP